jgi:DNA-binding Xre family transcriptional regulator
MTHKQLSVRAGREAVEALQLLRLDRDLTYGELADELGLSKRNLIRLMTERGAGMQDRTLHKIRKYLAGQASSGQEATA